MTFIKWGGLTPAEAKARELIEMQQYYALKRINEARAESLAGPVAASGAAPDPEWVTVTDTAFLYPIQDIEAAIAATEIEFERIGNRFVFATLQDLIDFYYEVYLQTAQSQPDGNTGYTMGVGTRLTGSSDEIFLDLQTGVRVIVWQLMTMLTPQWELPAGGSAPDGARGYGAVYCDLNADGVPGTIDEPGNLYIDPLRFVRAN